MSTVENGTDHAAKVARLESDLTQVVNGLAATQGAQRGIMNTMNAHVGELKNEIDAMQARYDLAQEREKHKPTPAVFKAISQVSADLGKAGISKARKNQGQGYNFRGIDDVYAAVSPLLAKYGLVIIPRVISRETVERTTAKGAAIFYTMVTMEFDFIAVSDGSKVTAATAGEAMDSGDKATNKAMSAAYKYACFQTFCIPTEAGDDADFQTYGEYTGADGKPAGDPIISREAEAKVAAQDERYEKALSLVQAAPTEADVDKLMAGAQERFKGGWIRQDHIELLTGAANMRKTMLKQTIGA